MIHWTLNNNLSESAKNYMSWICHSNYDDEFILNLRNCMNNNEWNELVKEGYLLNGFLDELNMFFEKSKR